MPFKKGHKLSVGNAGPSKDKPFRDALRVEIASAEESPRALRHIASKLIDMALSGDITAMKELADRIDGKVPQAVGGVNDDGELAPLVPIINLNGRP